MPKDQTPVIAKWTCFDQKYEMPMRPGQTCFFDCVALYNSLSDEQKAWVDNSLVEYKPSPYAWLRGAKAKSNVACTSLIAAQLRLTSRHRV